MRAARKGTERRPRVIAYVSDEISVKRILASLGLSPEEEKPPPIRERREQLAPYKRIRRLEFCALPKTNSERSAACSCGPRSIGRTK